MKKQYTPSYFKKLLPEWKRKKDAILTRLFYRPVSFVFSSLFVKFGIYANEISYLSMLLGIIASILFVFNNHIVNICGAVMVNIWLILDCADGNIARSIKKQAFGEFADAVSSYILIAFLFTCIGINVYNNGGLFLEKYCIISILLGCISSTSDSLMRLIHQKYLNVEREMIDNKFISNTKSDINMNDIKSLKVRLKSELGAGGILPCFVLICTIFNCLDLVLFYSIIYCFGSFVINTIIYILKAIKKEKNSLLK